MAVWRVGHSFRIHWSTEQESNLFVSALQAVAYPTNPRHPFILCDLLRDIRTLEDALLTTLTCDGRSRESTCVVLQTQLHRTSRALLDLSTRGEELLNQGHFFLRFSISSIYRDSRRKQPLIWRKAGCVDHHIFRYAPLSRRAQKPFCFTFHNWRGLLESNQVLMLFRHP
jgi:hypothetical protein